MATGPDTGAHGRGVARKLLVPTAVSAAGGAVGLLLTRRKQLREAVQNKQLPQAIPNLRETVSDLPLPAVRDGVADLTEDLRGKLDAVLGRDEAEDGSEPSVRPTSIDRAKYERRRDARRERREQRRRHSRS